MEHPKREYIVQCKQRLNGLKFKYGDLTSQLVNRLYKRVAVSRRVPDIY